MNHEDDVRGVPGRPDPRPEPPTLAGLCGVVEGAALDLSFARRHAEGLAPPLPPMAASRLECLQRDCAEMAWLLRKLWEGPK